MVENTRETKKEPRKADAFTPVTLQGVLVTPPPLLETHYDDLDSELWKLWYAFEPPLNRCEKISTSDYPYKS